MLFPAKKRRSQQGLTKRELISNILSYVPRYARSAAVPAVAAGVVGAGAKTIQVGRQHYQGAQKKRKMSNSKVRLEIGGADVKLSKRKKTVSKSKKSLKKRVADLEKKDPPLSKYSVSFMKPIQCRTAGNLSEKVIYNLLGYYNHDNVDAAISTTKFANGTVDLRTSNTSVKLKRFIRFQIKNVTVHKVHLKYALYKCIDDDGDNVLTEIVDYATDRGLDMTGVSPTGGLAVVSAGSTTINERPGSVILPVSKVHYELMSFGEASKKYKYVKGIQKITLQPGDSLFVYHSMNYNYKPERQDRENLNFLKDYDVGLLIQALGELGIGDVTSTLSAWAQHKLAIIQQEKLELTIDNGLGEKSETSTNAMQIGSLGNVVSTGRDYVLE